MNHRSSTPRSGTQPARSVLCVCRRSRRVVSLPRLRFAHIRRPLMFAVRSVAPLTATLRRFRLHLLPAIRFAPSLRLPLATFPKASARPAHAARTCAVGRSATALHSLHGTPPRLQIRKKGGVAASLRGYQIHSVNPATTVSRALESNALAASATGK